MIIIPAIDLRGGRCVRLTQGQASAETVYSENPVVMAKRWYDEGAEMLHIVNLDAALGKNDAANLKALESILYEVNIPVQFGGGVRSKEDVHRLDDMGVTRIVIGTTAIENPVLLEHIVDEFGSAIVVGIDARDGIVALRGWEKMSNIKAVDLALKVAEKGVERIVYTDIARDGMLQGINWEGTIRLAKALTIPVIASGGLASMADIERLMAPDAAILEGAITGRALYDGRIDPAAALERLARAA